jgi:hypothetical protein
VIRVATPDDLPAVTALVAEFYEIDDHEFDADRVRRSRRVPDELYVRYRGRGVGGELVRAVLHDCRRRA